ncbi:interferon-induced GTP-binding protein mx, putative [Ricinus communis]|uniref:Interferon-induced GTP-binding protein mx, putative n=1 Tax=Ricinus communis TaxID=3988 RepID=B9SDA1_RICCO|nr:interferon-induced GTP-binding protein mx, putative [Ricinus communis]
MVGIPVLAQKLTLIQATTIPRCLPDIVRNINEKLNANISELNKLPKTMSSVCEAMTALMGIIGAAKESLRKILLRGELDEYPDDRRMHCTARLVLEEAMGIQLPNFLSRSAFKAILWRKIEGISNMPVRFVKKVWQHIEGVIIYVLNSDNYHQLQCSTRRAFQNIIAKMKEQSTNWVRKMVQMEKLTDYTCNSEYSREWNINIAGLGEVAVGDLRKHRKILHLAFDLKMRMIAYWKVVLWRLVDTMALHLQNSIQNLVNKEMELEIIDVSDGKAREPESKHQGAKGVVQGGSIRNHEQDNFK